MPVAQQAKRQYAMLQRGEGTSVEDRMHDALADNFIHTAEKRLAAEAAAAEDAEEIRNKLGYPQSSRVVTNSRNRIEKPKRTKKQLIDLFSVAEVLAEHGLNPAEEIAKAIKSGQLDAETTVKLHATLLEYVAPKLKSVEMNGTLKVERTQDEIDARLRELAQMAQEKVIGP